MGDRCGFRILAPTISAGDSESWGAAQSPLMFRLILPPGTADRKIATAAACALRTLCDAINGSLAESPSAHRLLQSPHVSVNLCQVLRARARGLFKKMN